MIVAAVASLPGRPLERTLRSLRPQVDMLFVYLNGYPEIPAYIAELDCSPWWSTENHGSSAKLWFTKSRVTTDCYYFACDDDLEYSPDYVSTLMREFERWGNRVFVTACGRTLREDATHWRHWIGNGGYITAVPEARWINYLGGCAMAFHTSLKLPPIDPPNEEEAVLSVWAQRERIPIRLVARPYDWPKRIPLRPGAFTLYEQAANDRFATRGRIIQTVPRWTVHMPTEALCPVR